MDSPEFTGRKPDGTFAPGNRVNPAGRPKGARSKLQTDFLNVLADDFSKHGREAVEKMREERPNEYIKAIASLMPKQLEIERPLQEMSDDDLINAVAALQSFLVAQGNDEGTRAAASGEQAANLPAIH